MQKVLSVNELPVLSPLNTTVWKSCSLAGMGWPPGGALFSVPRQRTADIQDWHQTSGRSLAQAENNGGLKPSRMRQRFQNY